MKKKLLSICLACVLFIPCLACAQQPAISIIPQPSSLSQSPGRFVLTQDTKIIAEKNTLDLAKQLAASLEPATGYNIAAVEPLPNTDNSITLTLDPSLQDLQSEGYHLTVTPQNIAIKAAQPAGLFYGFQTLLQLLPADIFSDTKVADVSWTVPCVDITDTPRFSWRGMHLDAGRYFMPKQFVKKYINLLAIHKMNRFHWHLTEDQGWRIEIKKYPKLTEVGAWRKETIMGHHSDQPAKFDNTPHGGFYTQDDIREIVQYAQQRFVTIVPEIEMPGHSQAAIAAYPQLGNTDKQLPVHTTWGVNPNILNANESTILFMQDVLTEVIELFPSTFIHVGGDEAPKDQWKNSPDAQARIKELGLKDEHELQSYFIKRMDTFLAKHNRRLIGWDEILEGGLAPGATVMSWRGESGGIAAAKAGHDVVMAPTDYTYFDYYQAKENEPIAIGGFLPLETVYGYNPVPDALTSEQAKHILGVQAQVWTEYIPTPEKAEYMAYPRACALAEIAWTTLANKNYDNFTQRLKTHCNRLKALNVNFRKMD